MLRRHFHSPLRLPLVLPQALAKGMVIVTHLRECLLPEAMKLVDDWVSHCGCSPKSSSGVQMNDRLKPKVAHV
jgi:hypothetical protein